MVIPDLVILSGLSIVISIIILWPNIWEWLNGRDPN